jgi:hypothetical protein
MGGADVQDVYYAVVIGLGVVVFAWDFYAYRKRKVSLQALAAQQGWSYSPEASHLAWRWTGTPFHGGSSNARNALMGVDSAGRHLVVFDYRYQSGRTQHAQTVLAVQLTSPLPAGTAPRPGDRTAPHDPPLRVRFDGRDVLCWSDKRLEPEQIVSALTWLGARVDAMQRLAGAGAGVRVETPPPVQRSSSAASVLAERQTTSWSPDWSQQARSSALQAPGHGWWPPRRPARPRTVVASVLVGVLLAVALAATWWVSFDWPSQPRPADQSEVSRVRADLVRACAEHLGTGAADEARSRVAGNARQGYQVYLVSADNIPLGNCSAAVSGDGYRMLS